MRCTLHGRHGALHGPTSFLEGAHGLGLQAKTSQSFESTASDIYPLGSRTNNWNKQTTQVSSSLTRLTTPLLETIKAEVGFLACAPYQSTRVEAPSRLSARSQLLTALIGWIAPKKIGIRMVLRSIGLGVAVSASFVGFQYCILSFLILCCCSVFISLSLGSSFLLWSSSSVFVQGVLFVLFGFGSLFVLVLDPRGVNLI